MQVNGFLNFGLLYYLCLSTIMAFYCTGKLYAEDTSLTEYDLLKSFVREGINNERLYLRLSELESSKGYALCYAKIALRIDPRLPSAMSQVNTIKNSLEKTSINKNSNPSSVFYLKSRLSTHELNILIFCLTLITVLLHAIFILKRQKIILISSILVFIITSFVFFNRYFTNPNFNNTYKWFNLFTEKKLEEAIVVSNINIYSSQSDKSQVIKVLNIGEEVLVEESHQLNNSWKFIRTEDGRDGWVNTLNNFCIIKED